jgi:hypothetical protein
MAIDTLTFHGEIAADSSPLRHFDISIAGDDAYPTDGTATITATLRSLIEAERPRGASLAGLSLLAVENTHAAAGFMFFFDKANDKLVMRGWDGAQPAGASDQSATTYRLSTLWG